MPVSPYDSRIGRPRMLSISLLAGSCFLAMSVASCGGGDGGGPAPVTMPSPTSTPTPAPTPTPTPTSTFSYFKFAELSGSREFDSACGNWFGNQSTSSEWFATYPDNPETLAHRYDGPNDTWEIQGYARDGDAGIAQNSDPGPEYTYLFDAGDVDPASTSDSMRRGFVDANGNPVVYAITRRSLAAQPAEYVRQTRLVAKPGVYKIDIECVIGVPTEREDPLPSARFSYGSFAIEGTAHGPTTDYNLRDSTATWSVDPATGETKATVRFVGRAITSSGLSSTTTDLGSFITPPLGMLNLNLPVKSFSGSLYDSNYKGGAFEKPAGQGTFGGSFFGPQGQEIGIGFSLTGPVQGTNYVFTGTLIGRR